MTVFELARLRRIDLVARLLRYMPPHSSVEQHISALSREALVSAIMYESQKVTG